MALIPVLNSMFQAFNGYYYARWFYMLTLVMVLMTIHSLEIIDEIDFKSSFIWTLFFTLAIALPIGLLPTEKYSNDSVTVYQIGLEASRSRFLVYVGISLISLIIMALFVKFFKKRENLFVKSTAIALVIISLIYGEFIIYQGKRSCDYSDSDIQSYALNYGEDITIPDIKEVRSDFYKAMDNLPLYWQIPTIQAFHSIVPGSLMDFYNTVEVSRTVGSRPEIEYYGLRNLLSVKYLFNQSSTHTFIDDDGNTLMKGYKYIGTENSFDEYENELYIPMGFTYDKYICEEEFKNLSNSVKHLALLKAMVLTKEQMEKYRDITGYTDGMYKNLTYDPNKPINTQNPVYEGFDSLTSSFEYNDATYEEDCRKLIENTCSEFNYDNDGFSAKIDNKKDDTLLFFSIPYDEGWTAYVNGEKTEIEKVNIGFMAVKIDGHTTSDIRFIYKTPGLSTGIYITIFAAVIYILYIIFIRIRKKAGKKNTDTTDNNDNIQE